MTPDEIAALTTPLSEEEPCGPDLEMLGDPDHMRFTARIEAFLPKTFASFDRATIDFPAEFETLKTLLARSRDLRLLTTLAKLLILNRDFAGYVAVFKTVETLVDVAWPSLVPSLLDGDAVLRIVTLQTLDDMPDSVMPLQAAPLFETRRFGKVSFRSHLLANGLVQAREAQNEGEEGEKAPSASALKTALTDVELPVLMATRALAIDLQGSVRRIEALVNEKSGQADALRFERLPPLVQDMVVFLDKAVGERDPSLTLLTAGPVAATDAGTDDEPAAEVPTQDVGTVGTTMQAQAALAAAADYFSRFEPSSPILMLIAQVQALVGRSFYETMQALMPERSAVARLRVGLEPAIELPLERLSALIVTTSDQNEEQGEVASASEETAAEEEAASSDGEEAPAEEAGPGDGGEDAIAEPPPPVAPPKMLPATQRFEAPDRRAAMALLRQVAVHFRRAEPSSSIPLLLDRAEGIQGKDFFSLLRDLLPAASLRVDE